MCGILGKITFTGPHEPPRVFDQALAQIDHRGPDDRGAWHTSFGDVRMSLGQTRLSILDLSPAGHQPMISPRSGCVVVFNGEIYNFREIRTGLEAKGFRFTTECDTEVILAAYDDDPERFMESFRGMFAIALWDPARGRLVLVRDRLGIKPLYYYWDGSFFAFASEVTALAALPSLQLEVDQEAVREFLLAGYIPHPLSIFKNVKKLPAGHMLQLDLKSPQPRIRSYWDALDYYAAPSSFRDEGEVLEALRERLSQAVRLRLISDVPLGAFLSGGIDSSLIVALMRQVHAGAVRTFTIGFSVPQWDEAPMAKRIAEHLGTEHVEFYLTEDNVLQTARTAADHYDEPFADPSNIPTLELSRLTRRHVTVALSGDGGDELFWGYESYGSKSLRWFERARHVPRSIRAGVGGVLRLFGHDQIRRIGNIVGFDGLADFFQGPIVWKPWLYPRLHRHQAADGHRVEIARRVIGRLGDRDTDLVTGATDALCYMVDDILTKVDRASMSVALEARVPILDHKVVELAASIPMSFKKGGGRKKHLLKALLGTMVPRELWDRPKKGFGVPLVHWLRGPLRDWAHDELVSSRGRLHEWLDAEELRRMLDDHISGRRNSADLIWACLQLAGWDRRVGRIRSEAAGRGQPAVPELAGTTKTQE
ncbi:MAG TPA: asparagine synthase (glutamine-hydrolyzing) [Phycisphaerae bacterium]|nr:asparagine synthase (glutamine-hydrolyzing) [Phycisphaerae bacterium]